MVNPLDIFEKGEGRELYQKVRSTVKKYGMEEKIAGGTLIGLSGGSDSVMLLLLLMKLCEDFTGGIIACAHLNHGIRGTEADADEEFCRNLCASLNVEFYSKKIQIPAIAKERGIGMEECARDVRYSYFRDIISSRNDIKCIAVAHNATDNAETVIFNILRGSGSRGASGIPPVRDNIYRPLISIPKQDILNVLQGEGISYVTDSTNSSLDYSRNYIRHEILPKLKRLNPVPENMINRLSDNLRSDDSYITSVAIDYLRSKKAVTSCDLRSLHTAVASRVISIMIGESVSMSLIRDILSLLKLDNFAYSLPGDNTFICERGICSVVKEAKKDDNYLFWLNDGCNELYGYNSIAVCSRQKYEDFSLNIYKKSIQVNLSSAIIDGRLHFRPKKDGDTVYYGGMTRKLKKLFNDRGIPRSIRSRIPILCDNKGVVWVPGFGVRDDSPSCPEDLYITLLVTENNGVDEPIFYFGSEFHS